MQLAIYSIHAVYGSKDDHACEELENTSRIPSGHDARHHLSFKARIISGITFRAILWNLVICCPG
jgi:hypothetical protein